MPAGPPPDLSVFRDRIAAVAPQLGGLDVAVLGDGWDSVALEVGGEWIFKFPRHRMAEMRLRREVRLLALLRPRLSIAVPDMVLHETGGAFSQHRKIPGAFLLTPDYEALDAKRRAILLDQLAQMYAEIHEVPVEVARAAGAERYSYPEPPAAAFEAMAARLPPHLQAFCETTLGEYRALAEDPEEVYGYFDGHGWNMAFDHAAGRLNGVFDFADSALGPRHKDFGYAGWIHPDLSRRIARRYADLTGVPIDPERSLLHHSALRLIELADGVAATPEVGIEMLDAYWRRLQR